MFEFGTPSRKGSEADADTAAPMIAEVPQDFTPLL